MVQSAVDQSAAPEHDVRGDKGAETRNRLLGAAFNEIYRAGFQAASLQKILEHTGVTKGALYHHFPSKRALGYAVLDEIIAPMVEQQWMTPLETTDRPIDVLQATLSAAEKQLTDEYVRLGCPLNNLAQEMASVDEGFRTRIDAIYAHWRQIVSDALGRGMRAGSVRADIEPLSVAAMIVATLEGSMGISKTAQSQDLLRQCGTGLFNYLQTLETQG